VVLMPVLGVLDRFLHVLGKFAHAAMLPRKAAPSAIVFVIIFTLSVILFTSPSLATHRPGRFPRAAEWQSRCTEGAQLQRRGSS
jgi:hypothetical protein